jgi:DNA-binding GntR family transcriptional regulator
MNGLRDLGPAEVNSASLRDQAARLIKNAILKGEIPPGTVVSNEQLSSWLGISRTPIREALLELQKGGMVIIHRGKGTEVTQLSRKDVIEIFETREALETKSCELMIERTDARALKPLEEILERQTEDASPGKQLRFLENDHEFHLHIARCACNGRLHDAIEALRDQSMLLGTYALRKENRMNEVIGEHRAIVDALRLRDPQAVRDAVAVHLKRTCEDALIRVPDTSGIQEASKWSDLDYAKAGTGVL